MRLAVLVLTFALLASLPAAAQQEDVIIGDLTPHADCTPENARAVDMHDVARHPERYSGTCVVANGVVSGWFLFDSVDSLYRRTDDDGQNRAPSGRLGLYPQAASDDLPGVVQGDVVGVVGTCNALEGPNVIMVLGYCHHYGGAILIVSKITPTSAVMTRRTSERDRQRIGDLAFAPVAWRDLPAITSRAWQWLRAIENGDIAEFARLAHEQPENMRVDDANSEAHAVFSAEDSPFAYLRGSHTTPQLAVFVEKRPGDLVASMAHVTFAREAHACFCRESDCRGRWPISESDAANASQHPYVCADIYHAASPDSPLWVVSTRVWSNGLGEPREEAP